MAVVCWVMWLNRNDTVFKNKNTNSLKVIFMEAYWIRHWSLLSKEEVRRALKEGCRRLEVLMLQVFGEKGWRHQKRMEN